MRIRGFHKLEAGVKSLIEEKTISHLKFKYDYDEFYGDKEEAKTQHVLVGSCRSRKQIGSGKEK
jgi:hypothetical protein